MNNEQKLESGLEALVDAHDILAVVDVLSGVCYDKGTHLAADWNDTSAAKAWDKVGDALSGPPSQAAVVIAESYGRVPTNRSLDR